MTAVEEPRGGRGVAIVVIVVIIVIIVIIVVVVAAIKQKRCRKLYLNLSITFKKKRIG